MKLIWKFALPVAFVGAALGSWHMYKTRKDAQKLAENVQATRARALNGISDAQEKLGDMYYYGHGVPQDYSQALQWYRKAADQGNPLAQYGIGYMYDKGIGIHQDFAEASRLFEQAVDKGDRNAECELATMYYKGDGVPQDRANAAILYRRSADQGLARAEYNLGSLYYYGQGVTQDRTEARVLFRRAAEHGDEHAKNLLGLKLRVWLIPYLVLRAIIGIALTFRPVALNMWEPNDGANNYRDWLSVGTGLLFLVTAGLSWYGYTHNLIWCWVYGVTGFQLLKWFLDAFTVALLYFVFFHKNRAHANGGRKLVAPD